MWILEPTKIITIVIEHIWYIIRETILTKYI